LAEHYQKNNNQQKYDEYMKKLITNKTLDADVQLSLLGPIIVEAGNDTAKRKQGLELISLLAVQHPENPRVAAFYGDVLAFNNRLNEATEQYKKSLQIDPSSYKIWESLLLAYTDRENADSLIRYSEKALRLFPNQAMFHYLNGVGQMNKKDYAKAVKSISRGIDMQPEDNKAQLAQMYTTLGDVYNYMKKYTESDSSYEQALRADPMNATVLNNYAYYLSVRGARLEDAAKMSKKSLDIRKDEPSFLDTYGWILYKQGKYDDARTYIQKAIDINGEAADGTLWEHLGDVYYKQGNVDKAVECWTKAKEKGTENTDIDKKIKDRKLYEI
jgi:tetratricopeptide (TPR) repeat protein